MSGFDNEVMNSINWDFRGTVPVEGQATTGGDLPIGTGGTPAIKVGGITSTGGTVTISYADPNINIEATTLSVENYKLPFMFGGM